MFHSRIHQPQLIHRIYQYTSTRRLCLEKLARRIHIHRINRPPSRFQFSQRIYHTGTTQVPRLVCIDNSYRYNLQSPLFLYIVALGICPLGIHTQPLISVPREGPAQSRLLITRSLALHDKWLGIELPASISCVFLIDFLSILELAFILPWDDR